MTERDPEIRSFDGPRLTPYEIVFMDGDFESRVFPRIAREAAEGGVATLQREKFDFLSTVGEVVRDVTPEDAPSEALDQYRALLFQAYHHWSEGRKLYVLDTAAARYLVESAPELPDWSFVAPERSLYLQLPGNLFWSSISPDAPPEPVDGFFITTSGAEDAQGREFQSVDVLAILGIRRARAGFSVIPVEMETGDGLAAPWEAPPRSDGDFANLLPGGEIAGLYSVLTIPEVLKLVARAFWYIQQFPDSLVEVQAAEPRDDEEEAAPTLLAYKRITIGGAEEEEGAEEG